MYKRGEVVFADLSPVVGSEQGGMRPVLVVQNDKGNFFAPTIIVAPITRKRTKANLPTQVEIDIETPKGIEPSTILLEQIRTLDKERVMHKMCYANEKVMKKVNKALCVSVGV
ncbi:MAG: type II toxin-antitoxin system PemK/MazF family toxin [Streptococcaceae bacterium]|jgi:mRNA interferase MazF|nr:type II toxin-antitoxin system PemK/MazF family toxin [Streptococcaceae bacterium]